MGSRTVLYQLRAQVFKYHPICVFSLSQRLPGPCSLAVSTPPFLCIVTTIPPLFALSSELAYLTSSRALNLRPQRSTLNHLPFNYAHLFGRIHVTSISISKAVYLPSISTLYHRIPSSSRHFFLTNLFPLPNLSFLPHS